VVPPTGDVHPRLPWGRVEPSPPGLEAAELLGGQNIRQLAAALLGLQPAELPDLPGNVPPTLVVQPFLAD
jgi:hypothetical protein